MSGDDIVFGEVSYREPVRLRRPDRDPRWACQTYKIPHPDDLPIFLDHRTADAIERHALSDTGVELGGILLGKECLDDSAGTPFVWITRALEAKHYANTQASFTYTHDSWEEITRERDRLHPELDIVGWYHTHPSFGIFLSHHDLFIHQNFFSMALQVAYVVDPIQQTRGFFQWRGGNMAALEGFFLTAERADRPALARVANDLEGLTGPEVPGGGGGGMLSPRLEAELIKMLTRPTQHGAPATERLQTAMVFSLLGSIAGMLALGAALWLYQLQVHVQDQADALKSVARSVDQVGESQRLALDTLLEKAAVPGAAQFTEQYARAAKSRDEARLQLLAQQSINATLGARTKELESKLETLTRDLDVARKEAVQVKADAAETPQLREQVAALKLSGEAQKAELETKSAIAESTEGKAAADLINRLNLYRYAAYFGGILSAILGVAVALLYNRPAAADPEAVPTRVQSNPGETHRIN